MANNCYNYIKIAGSSEEISKLKEVLNRPYNDSFEIYTNLMAEFGEYKNEDCKWFNIDIHETDETEIIISGDSAWCPCLKLFTEISKRYETLEIYYQYEEMGCDFAGFANIKAGIIDDNCFTYWQGILEIQGEADFVETIKSNELNGVETLEELKETDWYNLLSDENKTLIELEFLETYQN